jgi:hypothetical protein
MRNAAGDEMVVPQQATLAFDDPEAMCRAALLGLGVTTTIPRVGLGGPPADSLRNLSARMDLFHWSSGGSDK